MNDDFELPEDRPDESMSVPMFPGFVVHKPVQRVLALFEKNYENQPIICFDEGIIIGNIKSYEEVVSIVFRANLLLYTDSLVTFPWIKEAIEDPQAKVLCNKKGDPLAIRIKRHNSTRWIVRMSVWELPCSMQSLGLLRRFYDYMGVGTHPTPGGIGWAMMRKLWKQYNLPWHTTLNGYADQYIRQHSYGGRCDTPGLGQHYDELLELDMRTAYLKYYGEQGAGTAGYFKHGYCDNYATWFARCTATIHDFKYKMDGSGMDTQPPALGPFPFRKEISEQETVLTYPIEPGSYETYLWAEQAEACDEYGVSVEVHEGYGWQTLSNDNQLWCDMMYFLLQQAPEELRVFIKKCIVAAIGRHRMENDFYVLAPEGQQSEKDIPIGEGREFYAYFVHNEHDFNSVNMPHYWSRTVSLCNLALLQFAYPYAVSGQLVGTNYDSVLVKPNAFDSICTRFPSKEASRLDPPGTWGWTELHNCDIPAPRSIECDEKIVRPGVHTE